ncbi:MAG TPA: neutral zinc metallopeptidase [Candidatus Limnocylindria bacterium]|nr:neutral zinc metallopeptidase [Candidatus Limnocylindria bacterium]
MTFDPNARLDPSRVEDRRGSRMGGPVLVGGGGIGILILIASLLLGVDPGAILDPSVLGQQQAPVDAQQKAAECRTGADANARDDCRIVGYVNSIEAYWAAELPDRGRAYEPAKTVLYSGYVQAECGSTSSAVGPFYCPLDQRIYLDLSFFRDMLGRLGARGGSFAEGYVVAHEYGHHVQNLLGLLSRSQDSGPGSGSVRQELMADCFAGVWAHHATATGYLQRPSESDIAAALDAAAAVGDDRIQKQTEGRVAPERWTHGSAEQRQQWFTVGWQTGDMARCDPR